MGPVRRNCFFPDPHVSQSPYWALVLAARPAGSRQAWFQSGSLKRPIHRMEVSGGSMGYIFGLVGFVFALSALGKIRRLEQRLKDAGVLKDTNDAG